MESIEFKNRKIFIHTNDISPDINFGDIVAIDTETTGLSFKEGHKIVEIACVETKDLISTGKIFHKLINIWI